jgi:hypothetical protein
MRPADVVTGLAAFEERGAGTDAERRAARWLARQVDARNRGVRLETFWCRPNWAFAHAWHVALGLVGGLVSVSSPRIGGALVLVALISLIADERLGMSLGRRLTREHASQNILIAPQTTPQTTPHTAAARAQEPVHLIITANYDAGRAGLAYRDWLRSPFARVNKLVGGRGPGWLAWVAIAMTWVLVVAIVRIEGARHGAVGAVQLVPTVGLVLALALLLDLATANFGPAASDNGSGVAVATGLAKALNAAPPSDRITVEFVLAGAGDGFGLGLRRYLRARRQTLTATNTVVLGIAASGSGGPAFWISDGQLVPQRYFARLRQICNDLAAQHPSHTMKPHHGRGATPALPARSKRLPAIAIGRLDERGLPARSHQAKDTPDTVDAKALDATVQLGLMFVDAIDAFLQERPTPPQRRRSGWRDRVVLRRPFAVLGGRKRESTDQLRT